MNSQIEFSVQINKQNVEELTKRLDERGIEVVGQTKTKLNVRAAEQDFIDYLHNGI